MMHIIKVLGEYLNVFKCAAIAQLGERQTEDLEVPSSILGGGSLH